MKMISEDDTTMAMDFLEESVPLSNNTAEQSQESYLLTMQIVAKS